VRSAHTFLAQMVGSRVRLDVEATPGLWPVFVDPLELWQLLINLVGNAAAAMPDGGRVVVRTGNESLPVGTQTALSHLPAGDYAVLRVVDDGRGMDAATQARMFEPFFSTRGVEGAGLGLSTVARIVTDAGGGLRVSSAPGRGTTVEIWVPRSTTVG
jgi:signal transduction histidine kinase